MGPFLVMSVAMVLTFQSAAPSQAPRDFALRLEFGCHGRDIVDTMAGTYVRTMQRGSQTAHIRVSPALKDQLFDLVNAARFDETPARVTGLGICEPATEYRLQVRTNGKFHVVSWDDCLTPMPQGDTDWLRTEPGPNDAPRMRALAEGILKPLQAMGEIRRLRPSDMYCL